MLRRMVLLAIAMTGTCYTLQAQTIDDALRFSTSAPAGTARAQSVGGALGSLGGEVSSIYVNPASTGFFRTSDFSFTLGFQQADNKGTYLGTTGSDSKGNLNISNATLIFGGKRKKPGSKWENFSFALGFNRTANYNERVYYTGTNSNSSLSLNYYLQADAAGITSPDAQLGGDQTIGSLAHGAVLAYQTYLIDYVQNTGETAKFYSAAEATDNSVKVRQENMLNTGGSANDISFDFGANYNNMLYLGGSVNIPTVHYTRDKTWRETNVNTVAANLNDFSVTEHLTTDGNGINVKLGAIVKPVKPLSLGVAFHSPSWIWFTDNYQTDMTTNTKTQGSVSFSSIDTNNGDQDQSKYMVRTPWKGVLSATYLFSPSADTRKPTGFLTFDYEYTDYASMKMRFNNDPVYDKQDNDLRNNAIKSTYQAASNIRVGGELKLHVIALRLGYALYGNPYKNSSLDATRHYYTGGIGYRNRGFYADLGLVLGETKRQEIAYAIEPNTQGYLTPAPATIKGNTTNVLATFGWKF
ncbi:Long-chain fatty acid transport protein [Chitinophaga sp. YR573]|uniref:OmpP1/FadL family transporter n=1 Tax=Chitinophaga sp. YR573 TaxID=1881040 RepID=UPI0008ACBA06|nr:hypothetical protein [Chitinophaga sp. YR573]SEW35413.1 Long-chain fatty acid transport protein [Chitinophaga sp. YR573]